MRSLTVRMSVAAAVLLLGGCGQMIESIQTRVEVSEECRLVTATPAASRIDRFNIGTIHLGNVGHCDITAGETLLAMCSYNQIKAQYIDHGRAGREAVAETLKQLDENQRNLGQQLRKLERMLKDIDKAHGASLQTLHQKMTSYDDRTRILQEYRKSLGGARTQLENVRLAHLKMHGTLQTLNEKLDHQARIELASWSSNLHTHLAKLEQLLSGDINMVWQAGLRDQIMTHVGRRSLELLHGSLKPADTVLNKLDERSHGALSASYLAFYKVLQNAFDESYEKIKEVFARRLPKNENTDVNQARAVFLVEMQRAACDHMIDGTRFSMLTELVDSMLVRKISGKAPEAGQNGDAALVSSRMQTLQDKAPARMATADREPPRSLFVPAHYVQATTQMAAANWTGQTGAADQSEGSGQREGAIPPATPSVDLPPGPANETTPLAVYVANEWAARHQLLRKQIGDKLAAQSGSAQTPAFPSLERIDEIMVTAIADAATAKSVDDAATRDPNLLTAKTLASARLDEMLASAVNLNSAATAVSVASAVLNANISVANVNTFNPSNYNHIAPVIQIATPEREAASLCAAWDSAATGAACSAVGDGYVITFPQRSYANDHCTSGDIVKALDATGSALAKFRDRHNVQFQASISGHASQPRATLKYCPEVSTPSDKLCRYANLHHSTIEVAGCSGKPDGNQLLSVGRAKHAAMRLEQASAGAVLVNGLSAMGTASAATHHHAGRPADDQTVVVRLTRLPQR